MAGSTNVVYGYDPTGDKDLLAQARPFVYEGTLPRKAMVHRKYLPPVGQQGTSEHPGAPGTCAAWAYVYGLVGSNAAFNNKFSPDKHKNQASPAHIYIQVMQADGNSENVCSGSSFRTYNQFLQKGTPNMKEAAYTPDCTSLWSDYNSDAELDARFAIQAPSVIHAKKDLDSLKGVLASGKPLCYGTALYTDFVSYDNTPVPYVGNNTLSGAYHCMLIVGYDDSCGENGAICLQNSFGTDWGDQGMMWMDVKTFQTLAEEGPALYFP